MDSLLLLEDGLLGKRKRGDFHTGHSKRQGTTIGLLGLPSTLTRFAGIAPFHGSLLMETLGLVQTEQPSIMVNNHGDSSLGLGCGFHQSIEQSLPASYQSPFPPNMIQATAPVYPNLGGAPISHAPVIMERIHPHIPVPLGLQLDNLLQPCTPMTYPDLLEREALLVALIQQRRAPDIVPSRCPKIVDQNLHHQEKDGRILGSNPNSLISEELSVQTSSTKHQMEHGTMNPERDNETMSSISNTSTIDSTYKQASHTKQKQGHKSLLPMLLSKADDGTAILARNQVLLRENIEIFRASADDVNLHTGVRTKSVKRGQMGIRCRHCAHRPVAERAMGSTYFPKTTMHLYQAAQNIRNKHIQTGVCLDMPRDLKDRFSRLIRIEAAFVGAGRSYWARTSKKLGLIDTEEGIRFDSSSCVVVKDE